MGTIDRARTRVRDGFEAGRATIRASRIPHQTLGEELPEFDPADDMSHGTTASRDDAEVSRTLRIAAAWSWRLLVVIAVAAVFLWALSKLSEVIVPLAIAMLLSALLWPAVAFLRRHGVPQTLATVLVLIGGVIVVAGTLTLVVTQFVTNYTSLSTSVQTGLGKVQGWLKGGIFHLTDKQLSSLIGQAQTWLGTHQAAITSGAISTAGTAVTVIVSGFLILFTTFFFLRDGDKIWRFLTGLLPRPARTPIADAGRQSWLTLVAYVRATVLVAFIDAVGIGIGLFSAKVELAFALAALVFLGAFIPVIGAFLTGTVAVLVTLVTRGPVTALVILGVVIAVQQIESHILQPLIMGHAVALHPLAVILAIAAGLVLAGIIGALIAVPLVAVLNTGIRHLAARRRNLPPPPAPDAVIVA